MKKSMKAVLSLVFALSILASCMVFSSAKTNVTLKRATQLAEYTEQNYNNTIFGPISITKGTFKETKNAKPQKVYLVCLAGLDIFNAIQGGYNDMLACTLSANDLESLYLLRIEAVMKNNIPEGSKVIFAGHSLGGMVAQQLIARPRVTDRYEILLTVTFGSPIIAADKAKEGKVVRYAQKGDAVPYSASSTIEDYLLNYEDAIQGDDGYTTDALNAHNQGYVLSEDFAKYDICGVKKGTATLTLDLDTRVFYKAQALKLGRGNEIYF